jgi:hypothetical protein
MIASVKRATGTRAILQHDLASRIDSHKGGIRSTFEGIPDAPVSGFTLEMQGAKKGLIVNSTDLCKGGRLDDLSPVVGASCGGKHHKRHRAHRKRGGRR